MDENEAYRPAVGGPRQECSPSSKAAAAQRLQNRDGPNAELTAPS